jgi:hypothetical protein
MKLAGGAMVLDVVLCGGQWPKKDRFRGNNLFKWPLQQGKSQGIHLLVIKEDRPLPPTQPENNLCHRNDTNPAHAIALESARKETGFPTSWSVIFPQGAKLRRRKPNG